MINWFPLLIKGALMTSQLLIFSSLISLCLGFLFGIFISDGFYIRGLSPFIKGISFVLRAVPLFVQLLIVYFVIPDLLSIELDEFSASIVALGLCSSGYVANIFKGSLLTIPKSQWEMAYLLGYNKRQTLYYLFLPQIVRAALPALTNEFEALLKSTAILSSIGVLELTRVGMNIVSREMQPLTIYTFVACFYIALSFLINFASKGISKRFSYARS